LNAITRANPCPRRVVKKDQIDIAGVIELVPTELAHAKDDQPAVALRLVDRCKADGASSHCLTQQMAQCSPERPVGKPAEGGGLLVERPGADQFSHGGDKCDPAFGDPQAPHQSCRILAKICG